MWRDKDTERRSSRRRQSRRIVSCRSDQGVLLPSAKPPAPPSSGPPSERAISKSGSHTAITHILPNNIVADSSRAVSYTPKLPVPSWTSSRPSSRFPSSPAPSTAGPKSLAPAWSSMTGVRLRGWTLPRPRLALWRLLSVRLTFYVYSYGCGSGSGFCFVLASVTL